MREIAKSWNSARIPSKVVRQEAFRRSVSEQGLSVREAEAQARLIPAEMVRQFKRGAWPR